MKIKIAFGVLCLTFAFPGFAAAQNSAIGLGSSAPVRKWTAQDVQTMCKSRWGDQTHGSDSCIKRNKGKIGHPETVGEMQGINALQPDAPQAKPPAVATKP